MVMMMMMMLVMMMMMVMMMVMMMISSKIRRIKSQHVTGAPAAVKYVATLLPLFGDHFTRALCCTVLVKIRINAGYLLQNPRVFYDLPLPLEKKRICPEILAEMNNRRFVL